MAHREKPSQNSKAISNSQTSRKNSISSFSITATAAENETNDVVPLKRSGRPPLASDHAKASLTLRLKNILWLDRLCTDIREKTGGLMDRGSLLRGLIDAIQISGIDLSHCYTEKQVTETWAKKLKIDKT